MHLQIEMEVKMKPALTSGIPERACFDLPEIENKTVEWLPTAKKILHRIGRRNLKLFGPVDEVRSQ